MLGLEFNSFAISSSLPTPHLHHSMEEVTVVGGEKTGKQKFNWRATTGIIRNSICVMALGENLEMESIF